MSFDLHLSLDSQKIQRNSYSIFDLFSDVGGLLVIIKLFFGCIAMPFSRMRVEALITNRLYHMGGEKNGDIKIDIPDYLTWNLLRYKVFFCCRNKNMIAYKTLTESAM